MSRKKSTIANKEVDAIEEIKRPVATEEQEKPPLGEVIGSMIADDDGNVIDQEYVPVKEKCFSCGSETEFHLVMDGENGGEPTSVPICTDCMVNMMMNEYCEFLRQFAVNDEHLRELMKLDMPDGCSICIYTALGDIAINKVPNRSTSMSDYNLIFAGANGSYQSRQFYTFRNQFATVFDIVRRLLHEMCPDSTMPKSADFAAHIRAMCPQTDK